MLVAALLAMLCASCAPNQPVAEVKPGESPPLESLEAGLWMQMERVERNVRTSGRLVRDGDLNAYVREVMCVLVAEHCRDIRVYIVRSAGFNASMAPNGTMLVWTGFLLRAENEAQLAFVLGHELAHYLRRHSLQRWRDLRTKTDAVTFFSLATAVVGLGVVGTVAEFATVASHFAYSRDQEREADHRGLELMAAAGYDPREASRVWDLLIREKEASDEPERLIFFSTHPGTEERSETLARLAEEIRIDGATKGSDRFLEATTQFRNDWFRDELRQRDFDRVQVVLDHLMAAHQDDGGLLYLQGELYRLRGDSEDAAKAADSYERAVQTGAAPVETYRSLGLVYRALERHEHARTAFQRYLADAPQAEDRAMIQHYIEHMP